MGKLITLLILAPIVYGVALFVASEYGGEVVELETHDWRGGRFKTSVWIVDMHGDAWIRSGDPESSWLARLRANPEVKVTRDGETLIYQAEVVEDFSAPLNAAMFEKYGRAEQLISTIHEDEEVVAVRLLRR